LPTALCAFSRPKISFIFLQKTFHKGAVMMYKQIFKTIGVAAVAAVFCVGCSEKNIDCSEMLDDAGCETYGPSNNGGDLAWTLNNGTLTISGTGPMYSAPWSDFSASITNVVIEEGVTSIVYGAFRECTGLTSVTIPNSVTSIDGEAFARCTSLTSITIPNSVTSSIGYATFAGCTGLTSVTIGNGVASIGVYAFERCVSLTSVTIGSSVTSIDRIAFYSCESLTSVTIPNSVTSIGEGAFQFAGLTSVTIPNRVASIGDRAFSGCTGLTSIEVDGSNTAYISIDGVLFNKAQDTLLQYPASKQGAYIIPEGVFWGRAFNYCTGLTSVTIPNSVTSIEEGAFLGTGLTSVTIPNSVTHIGDGAFAGCDSLTSVTIPNSVTYIGDGAFSGCHGLISVAIGSGVTYIGIGSNPFFCNSLTSIEVDGNNTAYSSVDGVLFDKNKTTFIKYPTDKQGATYSIPNGVTSIVDGAFYQCRLQSVTIPDGVTSIGKSVFAGCWSMMSVTIPSSVTSIGDRAFSGLTSVAILAEIPPAVGSDAFSVSVCLYVPEQSIDAYRSADGWKIFSCIKSLEEAPRSLGKANL
jgi:hypothetical protein